MKPICIFFAAGVLTKIRQWAASKSGSIQMWAFVGVLTLIALGAFFWAINFRKRQRHHHHHHHSPREPQQQEESEKTKGGWLFSRRRRRRKRKRRANPTLAEIGGLPEARDPNEPPTI